MDARSIVLAALLSAAASTSPLTARAENGNAPRADPGADPEVRRDACARMRAHPAWCRERDRAREERERVRRTEDDAGRR